MQAYVFLRTSGARNPIVTALHFPLQRIPQLRRWPVSLLLPRARHPLGPTSMGSAMCGGAWPPFIIACSSSFIFIFTQNSQGNQASVPPDTQTKQAEHLHTAGSTSENEWCLKFWLLSRFWLLSYELKKVEVRVSLVLKITPVIFNT